MRKTITILALLVTLSLQSQQLVNHKGQDVFFSGINLAWINFARDLTSFNEKEFTKAVTEIADAGGNSLRWWLHVNGTYSPQYTNDSVSGISDLELNNLKLALDIAAEKGIVVSLCLWSFDMMKADLDGVYKNRNRLFLEDSVYTMAYINNVLIPMVEKVKGHTGIMCWEIFNEPEGMDPDIGGWRDVDDVRMNYIQAVINRCSGAIHRTDSSVKVSSGCWNTIALSPVVPNGKNYYSDAELIAAGGDPDGIMDFYMLHYYPEWYNEDYSPFHHPAAYWQLDKPIVIAEFPAKGIVPLEEGARFAPETELTSLEAYNWLFENDYAGALSWTWTNHDGNGGVPNIADALMYLKTNHPNNIIVQRDQNHNYLPRIVGEIKDTVLFVNSDTVAHWSNLKNIFIDEGDLLFTVQNTGAADAFISDDTILNLALLKDINSSSSVTVVATDTGGLTVEYPVWLFVVDSSTINHLLTRVVEVSSEEEEQYSKYFLSDGDIYTRWSSEYEDSQWVLFDLYETESISRMIFHWEDAYGKIFDILLSIDNVNWTTVYSEVFSNGAIDNIIFEPTNARYVKVVFTERATKWGYSLYEIEAYTDNGQDTNQAPVSKTSSRNQEFYAESIVNYPFPSSFIVDPDGDKLQYNLRMKDGTSLPDWVEFDNERLVLSGSPTLEDVGTFTLILTGTDWFGQMAEYEIPIIIKAPIVNDIAEEFSNKRFMIQNPVINKELKIMVASSNEQYYLSVYTTSGVEVSRYTCNQIINGRVNLEELSCGLYVVKFIQESSVENEIIILK